MDSVREKTSANEPICKEEKAEFLIVQIAIDCSGIALITISLFPLG
jgi:hypothetical protein